MKFKKTANKVINIIKFIPYMLLAKKKAGNLIKNKAENDFIKLHLGCGTIYLDGWINIDNNSDNNIEKIDLFWDITKKLPIFDNSVDFIYNEHLLEHLSPDEAVKSIRDFMRVLKPGGIMRIAMPDLQDTLKLYNNDNWKKDAGIKKCGLDFIKTKAEFLNVCFRWWGHKWLYDREELERRLKEAGCVKIKKCELRKSGHKELCNLETREESTLIVEVTKI